jgi:hypothetical protein
MKEEKKENNRPYIEIDLDKAFKLKNFIGCIIHQDVKVESKGIVGDLETLENKFFYIFASKERPYFVKVL